MTLKNPKIILQVTNKELPEIEFSYKSMSFYFLSPSRVYDHKNVARNHKQPSNKNKGSNLKIKPRKEKYLLSNVIKTSIL